jgi:hypothetical protein
LEGIEEAVVCRSYFSQTNAIFGVIMRMKEAR